MIAKLNGALKCAYYSLKYGNKIRFQGIPAIYKNAEINIKQGKLLIGKGFFAKQGAYFAVVNHGQLSLGKGVSFGRDCVTVCHDSISIGSNVFIAPHVLIYDHDHRFDSRGIQPGFRTAPVTIGDHCWIGAGTVILRGTEIGDGCIIGANCVVKGKIPPYSLVTSGRDLNIVPLEERERKAT